MIIHLDQKDWIDLAKGFYGLKPELREVTDLVVQGSDSERAIFPISLTHFDETAKRQDKDSRERLSRFMVRVCKGWAILPATRIIHPEIEDACLKTLGLAGYALQKFAVKKGTSQLVGAKGELVWKKPPPPGLNEELLEKIESPDTLLMLLEHGLGDEQLKDMRQAGSEGVRKLEEIRKAQSQITDNDLRHRASLAQYLVNEISPKIINFLLEVRIDPKLFADKFLVTKDQIIRFFQMVPTAYNIVELGFRRDQLAERPIQDNDLNDIMSLSIALPYSDVVATERMWHSIILQSKLDLLRPTTVVKSVLELIPILKSQQ